MKKRQRKKLSFGIWAILFINYIAIISLLLSYLGAFLNPSFISFPQFFSIIYPLLFFINLFFVLFWISLWRKYFLYSLFALIIGISFFQRTFNFSKPERFYNDNFSIITYNVHLFNYYKWQGREFTHRKIFSLIKSKNPDLLFMQEFLDNKKVKSFKLFSTLFPYNTVSYNSNTVKAGLVIFSKFPIISSGKIKYKDQAFAIYSDIKIGQDTLRFINVHLRSIYLTKTDYNSLDSLKFKDSRLKKIVDKLTKGYIERSKEVKILTNLIDTTHYPIVLCGDFNDTPLSYTYTQISKRLVDAFIIAGFGLGSTYKQLLPILRIDYIFVSDDLQILDYNKIKVNFSDHYPLWAEIGK